MKKWMAGLAALCAAFLLSAAGCGPRTEQAESAGQEREAAEAKELTLDFYTWSDEETYVRQVVEAYNSLKGYEAVRLHVILNAEYEEWLKDYDDSYQADLLGLRGNANLLDLHAKGKLIGLGDYLRQSDQDVMSYGNMFQSVSFDGEYYALPTRSTCWVLYYNKELFDQAQKPYPQGMTWEEYLELAERMSMRDPQKRQWGGYYSPWICNISAIQSGYYLLDDDLAPTRDSLALVGRIYDSGSHMPYSDIKDRSDDYPQDFEAGNIAMMINGEWLANMLLEDQAAGVDVPEWGIAPLPVPEGVDERTTIGMYQFAAVTTMCPDPEAAFEFLCFLCGEEGAKIYARNAIIPAYCNDEIREIYAGAAGAQQAEVFFESRRMQEQPMWKGYDQLVDWFRENAELYLEKQMTLDEAMRDFEEKRENMGGI